MLFEKDTSDKNSDNIEEPEVTELHRDFSENNKESIIDENSSKWVKFYNKLRRKLKKSLLKQKIIPKQLSEYLLLLPDFFMLLCRLFADKRVKKSQKLFIGAVIAYIIMPLDFIPDFIPVIGYLDDLILVVYALNMILNEVDENILLENWAGSNSVLYNLQSISNLAEKFIDNKVLSKIKKWISKRK